jgi:truncated hemoglobin YjbI
VAAQSFLGARCQQEIGNNRCRQRLACMNQSMQVRGIDPESRQRLLQSLSPMVE